jgi:hypothetical protein
MPKAFALAAAHAAAMRHSTQHDELLIPGRELFEEAVQLASQATCRQLCTDGRVSSEISNYTGLPVFR